MVGRVVFLRAARLVCSGFIGGRFVGGRIALVGPVGDLVALLHVAVDGGAAQREQRFQAAVGRNVQVPEGERVGKPGVDPVEIIAAGQRLHGKGGKLRQFALFRFRLLGVQRYDPRDHRQHQQHGEKQLDLRAAVAAAAMVLLRHLFGGGRRSGFSVFILVVKFCHQCFPSPQNFQYRNGL